MFRYYMSLSSLNKQSDYVNIDKKLNFLSFNSWYNLYLNKQKSDNLKSKKIDFKLIPNNINEYKYGFVRRNFISKTKPLKKLSFYSNVTFLLIFISYFGILRLNTAFDWQYWYFLVKSIQKKDYNFVYKYFSYRSLFTSVPYSVNLAQMSALLGFLGLLTIYLIKNYIILFLNLFRIYI